MVDEMKSVNIIKTIIGVLFFYIATTWFAVAEPVITVEIDKQQVEYGKFFKATIRAKNLKQSLEALDLKHVAQIFFIDQKGYDRQREKQQLILKLYPRLQGELVFPVLKLANISTETHVINVIPGRIKGDEIQVNLSQSAQILWQRQQLVITLEVVTSDQFASLKTQAPIVPGFKLVPLESGRQWIKKNGVRKTHLRTGWAIYPLLYGSQLLLELPAVTYHLGGVQKRVYHLPAAQLEVKKLPPYIPPTMPVGKVTLNSQVDTDSILGNDTLAFWNLTLNSDEVLPQWFPAILRQVKSDKTLEFFPVESKRTMHRSDKVLSSEVVHRIPFKTITSGWHNLPELNFKYFDTETGRLVNVQHTGNIQFSIGMFWLVVTGVITFILLFYMLRKALNISLTYYNNRQKLKIILEELKQATDINQIRAVMREFGSLQQWSYNVSLRDWFINWRKCYKTDKMMQELINKITAASYEKQSDEDITRLRMQLYEYLEHPRRIRPGYFIKIR